jgi:hypothetical protein
LLERQSIPLHLVHEVLEAGKRGFKRLLRRRFGAVWHEAHRIICEIAIAQYSFRASSKSNQRRVPVSTVGTGT